MSAIGKFYTRVDRLVEKMKLSATPVPGFILGLSGTDSIVAFLMCYRAAEAMGMADRVYGIHYMSPGRRKPGWFEQSIVPWLKFVCPEARIEVQVPRGGNYDQCRWADLHLRALNSIGEPHVRALPDGENYWVVGTINATERALGTYSVLADTASIQPLHTLNKTAILAICKELDVPQVAMDYARQPDCFCGRDDLAAKNIELVDAILNHDVDYNGTPPAVLDQIAIHIREKKVENGFKDRLPYVL